MQLGRSSGGIQRLSKLEHKALPLQSKKSRSSLRRKETSRSYTEGQNEHNQRIRSRAGIGRPAVSFSAIVGYGSFRVEGETPPGNRLGKCSVLHLQAKAEVSIIGGRR